MMSRRANEDLAALLGYERDRTDQMLTEALLERRLVQGQSVLSGAADRLLREHAPWALDLSCAVTALIDAAGDERSRRLFVTWSLQLARRSQGDLAAEERVSATRIGQIVQRAEARVRRAAVMTPGPLPWAVRTLRERLGALTTEARVDAELASLGASAEPAAGLFRWLAGPYRSVPRRSGWIATEPRRAVDRTATCVAADGGIRRLVDVISELEDLDLRSEALGPWLTAGGATLVHDLVVLVEGSLPDAVERLLDAHGVPRTPDELAADLAAGGRTVDEGLLARALQNGRFAPTAKGAVRLDAWGPGPDRRVPTRKGRTGPAGRSRSDCPEAGTAPAVPSSPTDRLWLWVKIDDATLRGAEGDVPVALVEALGLEPPGRRTFSSRWGPVTLAYDGTRPTRGSVRAVALAVGVHPDEILLLGFSARGDVAVEVRPAAVTPTAASVSGNGSVFPPEIASGGTR